MSSFIYVHGTNGSGKSTLARAVIAAARGATEYVTTHDRSTGGKAGYTWTTEGVVLVGKYGSACGGVDGVHPYALVHEVLAGHAKTADARVFAEGLITPGVATCTAFAELYERATFIHLDTPYEVCLENVLKRRARAARIKGKAETSYTGHDNLRKKAQSAAHWADRLEKAGLTVLRLPYPKARETCLELLGLQSPSVDDLI